MGGRMNAGGVTIVRRARGVQRRRIRHRARKVSTLWHSSAQNARKPRKNPDDSSQHVDFYNLLNLSE
ncbi:hypothetical protein DF133_28925 [Burkholderia cenocepacia]|nr:hypothetical protein DF133_28925 [Burkholderia cenocepacia]